jgi:hypothetical protein
MSQNLGYRHVSAEQWGNVCKLWDDFVNELEKSLSPMTADQKLRVVRMGDGSVAFVEKAMEIATDNPGMLPGNFDLDELKRDELARQRMRSMGMKLTKVLEKVQNAEVAHGSDAMAGSLDIYAIAKTSGDSEGVEALKKMLGKRFERSAPKETPAPASA